MIEYKEIPLFQKMEEADIFNMLSCLQARKVSYEKEEILLLNGDKPEELGVVLSGGVQVVKEEITGQRTILASLGQGDTFAETFVCAKVKESPVTVVASCACTVLYLKFQRVISLCPASCPYHSRLLENMLYIIANRNLLLQQKMECISKRSTRQKILYYLSLQVGMDKNAPFTIPFDRQGLADYLCVERSALSKTICTLRDEGILDFHKSTFRFLI